MQRRFFLENPVSLWNFQPFRIDIGIQQLFRDHAIEIWVKLSQNPDHWYKKFREILLSNTIQKTTTKQR